MRNTTQSGRMVEIVKSIPRNRTKIVLDPVEEVRSGILATASSRSHTRMRAWQSERQPPRLRSKKSKSRRQFWNHGNIVASLRHGQRMTKKACWFLKQLIMSNDVVGDPLGDSAQALSSPTIPTVTQQQTNELQIAPSSGGTILWV
jgi:hypothetical protein